MPEDDMNFEEALRAMAHELGESLERAADQFNLGDVAGMVGVDPERARDWIQNAGDWLRGQTPGDWLRRQSGGPNDPPAARPVPREPSPSAEGAFAGAEPHPLDLPSEEQGLALAALDSGRWTLEPGTLALAAHAYGPGPRDALGLVRELGARDWIAADGTITLAGRNALERWLKAAPAGGR